MSRVLRFDGTTLVAAHDPLPDGVSPDLADSFLFRDRRVRAFPLHRERFHRELAILAPQLLPQLNDFYRACAAELEEEYESFPRFDLYAHSLWLRVRPLPTLTETVDAVTMAFNPDDAERKGPNIAAFTELNRTHGGETLRVDQHGVVVEGATSSLLWWNGETLVRSASADRVAGTTEIFLCDAAAQLGYSVQTAEVTPAQLRDTEVWLVNALHGIRLVAMLDGHDLAQPEQNRLNRFRATLDAAWEPLQPDAE